MLISCTWCADVCADQRMASRTGKKHSAVANLWLSFLSLTPAQAAKLSYSLLPAMLMHAIAYLGRQIVTCNFRCPKAVPLVTVCCTP